MATGPSHDELEQQFWPLGEWPDDATRERIRFIIEEGQQAPAVQIRASLPQTDCFRVGDTAPDGTLTTLDGEAVQLSALLDKDAAAGAISVLNFGSFT